MRTAALRHLGGMLDMWNFKARRRFPVRAFAPTSGQVPQRSKKKVKQYPHSMALIGD
jgi:hypothetical protein